MFGQVQRARAMAVNRQQDLDNEQETDEDEDDEHDDGVAVGRTVVLGEDVGVGHESELVQQSLRCLETTRKP